MKRVTEDNEASRFERPTIAAVVLTKNEEQNLPLALNSLQWVDELVVLDSGSSDRTEEIARKMGARFLVHVQTGEFNIAEQRNFAMSDCDLNSDWVLFIDADEVVTEELRLAITERLLGVRDEVVAFRLCPKFMFMGRWLRHVMEFPSWHDRLARRGRARFIGGVWEHFDPTCGEVEIIEEPYLHFSLNKGIARWIETQNRYTTDRARFAHASRQRPIAWKSLIPRTDDPRGWKRELETLSSRALWLSPAMRFAYSYFMRRGFLDGYQGFTFSCMLALHQYMIYLKALELERRDDGKPL